MELSRWLQKFPLPPEWSLIEDCQVPFEQVGVSLHLAGLVAQRGQGPHALGSAAGSSKEEALPRAFFELLERMSIVEAECNKEQSLSSLNRVGQKLGDVTFKETSENSAPESGWMVSRSNGVAAGPTFDSAVESAELELIERDRLLRSWFGETAVEIMSGPSFDMFSASVEDAYEIQLAHFGEVENVKVTGVFGFPKMADKPLVFGFGAGRTLEEALGRAKREFSQRLGFLWSESVSTTPPEFSISPNFHQEYFLVPENHVLVRNWLEGRHWNGQKLGPTAEVAQTYWVDITLSQWNQNLKVVKAVNPTLMPLTFGRGHPWVTDSAHFIHPFC